MMSAEAAGRAFGRGPLSRACATVYTLLVVEVLLLLAVAPGLVALVLLDRDASNLPLAASCALPFGPAFSAALYALRHRGTDLADLHPAAAFWRGYRLNAVGVLKVWIPWLAGMALVAPTLAHRAAAGVPGWWSVLLVAAAAAATLWVANALVITSLFAFRGRDVARLAAYFLVHRPKSTLGTACLLLVVTAVTVVATEALPALLASVLAVALLQVCRPVTTEVREEFTA